MITLTDVSYQYPGADAHSVADVTLQIGDGEFVAILGPNGSGKSTLARLLNGLLLPMSGQVTVDGADTVDKAHRHAIRRRVQMIFQNPENQIVGSTLAEDVAFGLSNVGYPQADMAERITWALGLVGLANRADDSPHALSGGEKQKLAAASALALEPHYLVLDEATAMLDPISRQSFLKALHEIRAQRAFGLICITHHLEEVLGADRVVLLDGGKVVAVAPPVDLLLQPDLLEACGIEVPFLPALALQLGLPVDITPEELVARACD